MKISIKILTYALVVFSLSGCLSDDDVDKIVAKLDTDGIDKLGVSAANLIPGCAYSGETGATPVNSKNIAPSLKLVQDFVKTSNSKKLTRANTINETENGECGGTQVATGTETALTYTLTNFCTYTDSSQVDKTVLNGSYTLTSANPESQTLSTQGSGITIVSTINGTTSTETVYISNFTATQNGEALSSTIDKMGVISDGKTYEILNTVLEIDASGEFTLTKATYVDPENGPLEVSMDLTGDNKSLTLSGNGSTATFTDTGNGNYQVTESDGSIVGSLDCSSQSLL